MLESLKGFFGGQEAQEHSSVELRHENLNKYLPQLGASLKPEQQRELLELIN